MNRFEKNISHLLNKLAIKNKLIFYFFRVFTFTGEWWMYILYAIIIMLIDSNKGADVIKMGLIAFGLHYPIYFLIKNTTKRTRPFEEDKSIKALVKPPDKYSLPSGHTAGTCISALIIMSIFGDLNFLIVWPIIVGLSRVFLGVHYFSDSLIGLILGYVCYYAAHLILL